MSYYVWYVQMYLLNLKDWSNPLIRPHIQLYPEIATDSFSEVWHGDKWRRDMDPDALSPMYDAGERHYYVNELALLRNGALVIPHRWVVYQGTVHAESRIVHLDDNVSISFNLNIHMKYY